MNPHDVDDPVGSSRGAWTDIGSDISIREVRNAAGVLLGIDWRHPGCAQRIGWICTKAYMSNAGWDVESEKPLTLSPSILCTVCKTHGYIRDGRWVSC